MSKGKKIPQGVAVERVAPVLALLGKEAKIAGSLRRGKEYVRDVDIVFLGTLPTQAEIEKAGFEWVQGKDAKIRLIVGGMQVDVIRAPDEDGFGAAWLYLTGPHTFNIKMRSHAAALGLLLNEKGVYKPCDPEETDESQGYAFIHVKRKGETEKRWYRRIAGKTEREVFEALGLEYTTPPARDDLKCFRGEVEWECEIPSAKDGSYRVWLGKNNRWNCECEGFQFRRKCRHIETAQAKYNKECEIAS